MNQIISLIKKNRINEFDEVYKGKTFNVDADAVKAIKDIYWVVSRGNFRYPFAFIDGFRAAEKHHNITEQL